MSIPDVDGLRHPLQIYDAVLSLGIALVCYLHLRFAGKERPGVTFAIFLTLYGVMRFILEYIREQQYSPLTFGEIVLSRGQLLTIPIFLLGLLLLIWFSQKRESDG
jgi:phosphatidylglycerol:prolipoprotein diacylglycerol transferase